VVVSLKPVVNIVSTGVDGHGKQQGHQIGRVVKTHFDDPSSSSSGESNSESSNSSSDNDDEGEEKVINRISCSCRKSQNHLLYAFYN